jgi:hypothetical protein
MSYSIKELQKYPREVRSPDWRPYKHEDIIPFLIEATAQKKTGELHSLNYKMPVEEQSEPVESLLEEVASFEGALLSILNSI